MLPIAEVDEEDDDSITQSHLDLKETNVEPIEPALSTPVESKVDEWEEASKRAQQLRESLNTTNEVSCIVEFDELFATIFGIYESADHRMSDEDVPGPVATQCIPSFCVGVRTVSRDRLRSIIALNLAYDPSDVNHWRALCQVYENLIGSVPVARIGGHWESIGFQGADPCTDLNRSNGLLNLMLLLSFVKTKDCKDLFLLSQDTNHFPFALVSIAFGSLAIDAYKRGKVNLFESFRVISKLHEALFRNFKNEWKHSTINDFGNLLLKAKAYSIKLIKKLA